MGLSFNRLKWISIVGPAVALLAFLYVAEFVLDDFFLTASGFLATTVLVTAGVFLFSLFVFRVIARLQQRIVQQNRSLATSASVAMILSEASGKTDILQGVLNTVLDSFSLQAGVICLLDEEADELFACAERGLPPAVWEQVKRSKLSDDPVGAEVIRAHHTVVGSDISKDPRTESIAKEYGIYSFVSLPLMAEGLANGVMALGAREKDRFSESDIQLLEQIARQIGIAVEKATLLEQVLGRNEELRLLNDVSAALSSTLELNGVMTIALEKVLEASGADRVELWLEERGQESLVLTARGDGSSGDAGSPSLGLVMEGQSLRQRVARAGEAQFVSHEAVALGCLPLQSEGHVFGTIYLVGLSPTSLTPQRRQMLGSIADQSSVAIPNAQLHERVQELAVLEERERIAREMHDGLAQVLGYVNTKAFAIRRLLKDGDVSSAQAMLAQLEEAAREVYADVREGVLALRSTDPSTKSLLESISEYLEKFERMSGIHVECEADDSLSTLDLPEMAEIQVMRIIQEALSNVRKHAAATNVCVRLDAADGTLTVRVDDDGRGFDAASLGRRDRPHFGLQTMRERAEAVGGRFAVTSAPMKGTQVAVSVPVAARDGVRA
jgi:nitrate/nitrite-specific signal transduction histidine kinase